MELFLRYLRGRLPLIGLFLTLCALFTGSLLLYQLPVQAVLYPAGLCLLLLALYLGLDYSRTAEPCCRRKTRRRSIFRTRWIILHSGPTRSKRPSPPCA